MFSYPTVEIAAKHMDFEIIEEYGDGDGFPYYTWDDGHRTLLRCKNCGALFLRQISEFHSMSDTGDHYYMDYFPVESREQAIEYNNKYNGFSLEMEYKGFRILKNDSKWVWRKPEANGSN